MDDVQKCWEIFLYISNIHRFLKLQIFEGSVICLTNSKVKAWSFKSVTTLLYRCHFAHWRRGRNDWKIEDIVAHQYQKNV